MRKTDLHPDLQKTAVPVPGKSGVYAVMPAPVPTSVPVGGCGVLFALARREMDALAQAVATFAHAGLLLRMLNRREAVESSQIEGTHTGFDDLLLYEINLDSTDAVENLDASETLAYVTAFHQAMAAVHLQGSAALTAELIRQVHGTLMAGQPRVAPGIYRDRQNFIGLNFENARFIPPPASAVPALMADLERLLQFEPDSPMVPSILMRAAIAHVQFEAIHPFLDGNGRTGRLILPLMLLAEGEVPIHLATFLKIRQQNYYDALIAAQMKLDWQPWLKLFLECVIASCLHTTRLIEHFKALSAGWGAQLSARHKRKHATVHRLLDILPGHPVLTANEVCRLLSVSFPSADAAIDELVALDILRLVNGQRRNRVYQAHQVLNALYTGMDDVLKEAEALARSF